MASPASDCHLAANRWNTSYEDAMRTNQGTREDLGLPHFRREVEGDKEGSERIVWGFMALERGVRHRGKTKGFYF